MALIVSRWRTWLAFGVLGSAVAFAYRGDWAWCAGAASLVLLRAACWVASEMLAIREMLREAGEQDEGAEAAGRHRRRPAQAYTCSRCGAPGVTEWPDEEAAARWQRLGLDLVCDACLVAKLRLVASLNGAGD